MTTKRTQAAQVGRENWIDLVRALALARVVLYHSLGNSLALTLVAAVPVMLVMGGKFTMQSLARSDARDVIVSRVRRVGIPTVVYVVVMSAALLVAGASLATLLRGLVTDLVPGVHLVASDATNHSEWLFGHLWYVRDYVLFVLASPLIAEGLRRSRRWTLVGIGAVALAAFVVGSGAHTAVNLVMWTVGMVTGLPSSAREHRRGDLTKGVTALAVGVVVMSIGAATGTTVEASGDRVSNLAVLLLGLGLVAIVQHSRESLQALVARRRVGLVATWMNQRAVTIYLWHMPAVVASFAILGSRDRGVPDGWAGLASLPLSLVLTLVLVLATAQVERFAQGSKAATMPFAPSSQVGGR